MREEERVREGEGRDIERRERYIKIYHLMC